MRDHPYRSLGVMSVLSFLAMCALMYAAGSKDETSESAPVSSGYVCPITGETLPCPDCCPLNDK